MYRAVMRAGRLFRMRTNKTVGFILAGVKCGWLAAKEMPGNRSLRCVSVGGGIVIIEVFY